MDTTQDSPLRRWQQAPDDELLYASESLLTADAARQSDAEARLAWAETRKGQEEVHDG